MVKPSSDCYLTVEKKPFKFWRNIWISILVTLLQLYRRKEKLKICRYDCTYVTWYMFLRYLRKEEMSVCLLTLDNLTWNVLTAHRRSWLTILLDFYCLCVPVIWSFVVHCKIRCWLRLLNEKYLWSLNHLDGNVCFIWDFTFSIWFVSRPVHVR